MENGRLVDSYARVRGIHAREVDMLAHLTGRIPREPSVGRRMLTTELLAPIRSRVWDDYALHLASHSRVCTLNSFGEF